MTAAELLLCMVLTAWAWGVGFYCGEWSRFRTFRALPAVVQGLAPLVWPVVVAAAYFLTLGESRRGHRR